MFFLDNDYLNEDVQPTNMGLEGLEGALIINNECDEMWYNLREKMMKLEHTAIVTEDAYLLQEGKASFMENVKAIFEKMRKAVEEMFRRFMDWVTRLFASDKTLVERLGTSRGVSKTSIKGYKYTNLEELGKKLMNSQNIVNAETLARSEYAGVENTSAVYEIAAKGLGLSAAPKSNSEYVKALTEYVQGSDSKVTFDVERPDAIAVLKVAKEEINKAKRAKAAIQAALKNAVNSLKSAGKSAINADSYQGVVAGEDKKDVKQAAKESGKDLNKVIANVREGGKCIVTAFGIYIKGLQGRRSQMRAACPGLLKGAKDGETSNDSSTSTSASEGKNELQVVNASTSIVGILGQF